MLATGVLGHKTSQIVSMLAQQRTQLAELINLQLAKPFLEQIG
jgi:hypothetical protein